MPSARGTYGTAVNSGKGRTLGGGSNTNSLQGISNPVVASYTATPPAYCEDTYTSGGTVNYQRTGAFITVDGKVNNLNNIVANDFFLTQNGTEADEQHSSKYGRKLAITEIDQNGNITYGATNGTTYGLYHTSGTPVDRNADNAKAPYGTPTRFVSLDGPNPVVHSFNRLSSN